MFVINFCDFANNILFYVKANKQEGQLMVKNDRRPCTFITPEDMLVRCLPFKEWIRNEIKGKYRGRY